MARAVDVNNPPSGGFKDGAWYWDPAAGQARQYWKGSFGPPNTINNPNQQGYGQAVGQEGGGGQAPQRTGDPISDVNRAIEDSFRTLQNEVIKKFGEYQAGKPFRIDEVLAAKSKEAAEQIDPYYNEILGDYLLGVTRKINRSRDDAQEVLTELTESKRSFTQESATFLEDALQNAEEGYADAGLLLSGKALSTEGQLKQRTGSSLTDFLRKNEGQTNRVGSMLNRTMEDIGAEKKGYVSDLERGRFTDIETRKSQLAKEAGQQYVQGFQATLPTELQSASGFDMLKSLGVYS